MTYDTPDRIADLLRGIPLLLMLDIDGTLCDIVPRADAARVPAATQQRLQHLARIPDVHVALITGRSVRDALRMVNVSGVHVHGNHGIEMAHPDGEIEIAAGWADAAAAVHAAATELARLPAEFPGTFLEYKDYTITMHYRDLDPMRTDAFTASVGAIAARNGVLVEGGKAVLNVVPDMSVDKGTSVLRLVNETIGSRSAGSVLFAGDDVTDEHAFRALAANVPSAVTIRIGDGSVPTAARHRFADPGAVRRLLALIDAKYA